MPRREAGRATGTAVCLSLSSVGSSALFPDGREVSRAAESRASPRRLPAPSPRPTGWWCSESRRQGRRPGWPRRHGPAAPPDLASASARTTAAAAARCMAMRMPAPAAVAPGRAVAAASVRGRKSRTGDASDVQRATRRKRRAGLSERNRITAGTPVVPSAPGVVKAMVGPGPAGGGNSEGTASAARASGRMTRAAASDPASTLRSGLPEASRRRAPVRRCGHRLDPLTRPFPIRPAAAPAGARAFRSGSR